MKMTIHQLTKIKLVDKQEEDFGDWLSDKEESDVDVV